MQSSPTPMPTYVTDAYGRKRRVQYVRRTQPLAAAPPQMYAPAPYHAAHTAPLPYVTQRKQSGCVFVGLLAFMAVATGLLVLFVVRPQTQQSVPAYAGRVFGTARLSINSVGRFAPTPPAALPAPSNSIVGVPTLTAAQIDAVLVSYGSPAEGSGKDFYELGVQYGIDPAYPLAFFVQESTAGSNTAWAGWKADSTTTHNVGNIICAGYAMCYGRFRDYPTWRDGIADWYKLLDSEYIKARGATTLDTIIPIYAPSSDGNDVAGYINTVQTLVNGWRNTGRANAHPDKHTVTEGMHVNAGFSSTGNVWCFQSPRCQHLGTDYAGTDGQMVYAPFEGVCIETGKYPEGGPTAGQYVRYVLRDGYELYLGHLKDAVDCTSGKAVQAGDVLGAIRGDLAHTHVQLKNERGELTDFEPYFAQH